ncbi:MAG: cytochrome c biogenesis protein CcsA [Coriobacteriia bacterium]|nr:cytochrome c biogenesis protein CcsA [Coriobacteriia bacterium]
MSGVGIFSLGFSFFVIVVSIGFLIVSQIYFNTAKTVNKSERGEYQDKARKVARFGYLGVLLTAVALTLGCGILVYGFVAGDYALEYVAKYHSNSVSSLRLLFEVSGLWAGREGSLLFWAWLISLFGVVVAVKNLRQRDELDNMALLVIQVVMLAFVAVLLFSSSNMPFLPLDPRYLNESGNLKSVNEVLMTTIGAGETPLKTGMVQGMNILLEHWAMAIHPPTLFIGYAGQTVPFAYAIAALIVNDPSKKWVLRSTRFALFSWIFLGIGIGLGAVWAYVVLGWGGYWGWDPVENASLLSWIITVALIHSFTVYRQRGGFKRWSVMCACMAFAFVIVGTFITRSGVVQNSVHAFSGDTVSLWLFLGLIILSLLAGGIGLAVRWQSFAEKGKAADLGESFFSRDVAYYFNNVLLLMSALILTYMTVASALPSWLPWGGLSLAPSTFYAIARPLGILYCLVMAVCPLLSWARTDKRQFLRKAKAPAIGALALFVLLMIYFIIYLVPSYDATIAAGGSFAATRLESGSAPYYFFLTILGFLVASLLFFNSFFMLGRVLGVRRTFRGRGAVAGSTGPAAPDAANKALPGSDGPPSGSADEPRARTAVGGSGGKFEGVGLKDKVRHLGAFLSHLSIAVILIGLIGSSMYVTEKAGYIPFNEATDQASGDFVIQDYRLVFDHSEITPYEDGSAAFFSMHFKVYKKDRYVGRIAPAVHLVPVTQERKPIAGVISTPAQDLFVVYNGLGMNDEISLSAWVNPLISFVWTGFGLLIAGTILAAIGRRKTGPPETRKVELTEPPAATESADKVAGIRATTAKREPRTRA